jgi:hypothetical protein
MDEPPFFHLRPFDTEKLMKKGNHEWKITDAARSAPFAAESMRLGKMDKLCSDHLNICQKIYLKCCKNARENVSEFFRGLPRLFPAGPPASGMNGSAPARAGSGQAAVCRKELR